MSKFTWTTGSYAKNLGITSKRRIFRRFKQQKKGLLVTYENHSGYKMEDALEADKTRDRLPGGQLEQASGQEMGGP